MYPEEIERSFVEAGWEVPGASRYPIVGNNGDLSIVAHEQYAQSADPVFEIAVGMRMLSHWSREIITPLQAAALLDERGGPPEEERGNPHKRD
jgi:hypothetical protein